MSARECARPLLALLPVDDAHALLHFAAWRQSSIGARLTLRASLDREARTALHSFLRREGTFKQLRAGTERGCQSSESARERV